MTLRLALPDTALIDCTDLKQKTIKIGQIARSAAVFRVEEIVIYSTEVDHQEREADIALFSTVLRYMDTPQYLRKAVFPRMPILRYAGILPPLRTKSHPLNLKIDRVVDNEVRWGTSVGKDLVDIGLEKRIPYSGLLKKRGPTLFRTRRTDSTIKLERIERKDVETYFGFAVTTTNDLVGYLNDSMIGTRVAFSRKGIPFKSVEVDLAASVDSTKSIIAIFGGPQRGLRELFPDNESVKISIDFWINSIPDQGTETVRLEEAVNASLALINIKMGDVIAKSGYYPA